jgi:hypothetical protein
VRMERLEEWPHRRVRVTIRKTVQYVSFIKAFYYRWIVGKQSTSLCSIYRHQSIVGCKEKLWLEFMGSYNGVGDGHFTVQILCDLLGFRNEVLVQDLAKDKIFFLGLSVFLCACAPDPLETIECPHTACLIGGPH